MKRMPSDKGKHIVMNSKVGEQSSPPSILKMNLQGNLSIGTEFRKTNAGETLYEGDVLPSVKLHPLRI